MPNFRRFLSRRWLLGSLGAAALLFGVLMLHPYPRQSLFGPTIRGEPWCAWENTVRRQFGEHRESFLDPVRRWFGSGRQPMSFDELFDDPEMLPLVVALLDDPDPQVRGICASAIILFPCLRDHSALPALRIMLNDGGLEGAYRVTAAEAIWRIDKDEKTLRWIVKQLDHADSEARSLAMGHVASLCDEAPELFPHVVAQSRDPEASVRCRVMYAMVHFAKKGMPILIDGMRDPDPLVRGSAVAVVEHMGADAKTAVPVVEMLMADADPGVASQARAALQRIDPARYQHLQAERKIE